MSMVGNRINDAWNFIGGWYIDGVLCDSLVQDFENRKKNHKTAPPERGYTYVNMLDLNGDCVFAYETQISLVLKEYIKLYKFAKETISPIQLEKPYNLQKYSPGSHYSVWHCENNGIPPFKNRHLAFMTYLNDVQDCGETEFLYQNVKIRPEKGLTLVWPAYFTHIHKGIPSPSQEKYVVTGWYEFFDSQNLLSSVVDMEDFDFYNQIDRLNRDVT